MRSQRPSAAARRTKYGGEGARTRSTGTYSPLRKAYSLEPAKVDCFEDDGPTLWWKRSKVAR